METNQSRLEDLADKLRFAFPRSIVWHDQSDSEYIDFVVSEKQFGITCFSGQYGIFILKDEELGDQPDLAYSEAEDVIVVLKKALL